MAVPAAVRLLAGSRRRALQCLCDRLVQDLLLLRLPPLFARVAASRSLTWHLARMRPRRQSIDWSAIDRWQELPVDSAAGVLRPALRVLRAGPPDAPLLLFHHGAGEVPTDTCVGELLAAGELPARVVLLRAVGHASCRGYAAQMRDAEGALLMLLSSAAAMEAARRSWNGPALLTGISLGGMISLLHARLYGETVMRDAPCVWAPIAAGPDFDVVARRAAFARLVDRRTRRLDSVEQLIDLPYRRLPSALGERIRPLLGLWDLVQPLRPQIAAYRALGIRRVRVLREGHIGLSLDGACMHEHCGALLRELC